MTFVAVLTSATINKAGLSERNNSNLIMFARSSLFLKRFPKHVAYAHRTVPGENLPWSIKSIWGLTIRMALFYGIGFAAPFGIVTYQILKKRQ